MIERSETVLPILTRMTSNMSDSYIPRPTLAARWQERWTLPAIAAAFLASPSVCGQSFAQGPAAGPRAILLAPEAVEQPSSPWSKPFRVAIPSSQPHRLEVTQFDSSSSSELGGREPEVAGTEARPPRTVQATLASQVSRDVLSSPILSSPREVQPLEKPPGWASVEKTLRSGLERCDHLLRRGAIHSARQEALTAVRHLVRVLDLHRQRWDSEPICQQALSALREAEDFERSSLTETTSVHRIVRSHETPVLQEVDLDSLSPSVAAQHYRAYARDALVTAADGHPWAAELYYALGKTYERESELDLARQMTLLQHATVCYQAAHALDTRQHHIASQLGFNLLQLDRVDEAMRALESSLMAKPSANAYRNLAEALRRKGDLTAMRLAAQQAAALEAREPQYSPERPEITEISPAEFARISPPPALPEGSSAPKSASARSLAPTTMR